MGGKSSCGNPIWSFREMPRQNDGGILQGSFDKVEMVIEEEVFSHKCPGITGIKIYNPDFHKVFVRLDHSCSSGQ